MKARATKHLGEIVRGRRPVGHGWHRPLGSGRRWLLGAIVPAALAAATLFPAAASADLTQGFHVFDYSRYPIKLIKIVGGDFQGGGPAIGSVLQPGDGYMDFEEVYHFAQNTQGTAVFALLGPSGEQGFAYFNAGMAVNDINQGYSRCSTSPGYGQCSPGNDDWHSGKDIVLYDNPGTVIDLPASQGQQQAAALKQFCNDTNAATCKFTATSETDVSSPAHAVGRRLVNESSEEQDTTVTVEDKVGATDSVEVGLKVGGKIYGLVDVEVSAKYGHEWTTEHTFSQDVTVHCPAHHTCWIEGVDPMLRDTGDFTMNLGNTTWHLHDIYFDSPNPGGTGAYVVKDCEIGTAGCPGAGEKLGSSGGSIVLSGTYIPPAKAAVVKPDLGLRITGPAAVTAGGTASYQITIGATPDNHYVYAVNDVRVRSSAAGHSEKRWLLARLATDKSRTLALKVAVPSSAHGRFCVNASADAKHANGAHAQKCVPVTG